MGVFDKFLERFRYRRRDVAPGVEAANCPGCGRPVANRGDICGVCGSQVEDHYGG